MIDEYKIAGPTSKLAIEIETKILEQLGLMAEHKKLSLSAIVNTALKGYVSRHKDFLPPGQQSGPYRSAS